VRAVSAARYHLIEVFTGRSAMRDNTIFVTDQVPLTFDEKMKAGQSLEKGLTGAMTFREQGYEPYDFKEPRRQRVHKPVRCSDED
jgi:hypothetical protein